MWDEEEHTAKTPEAVRREWVEGELFQWIDTDDQKQRREVRYTEFGRALEAISTAALAYAEANGLSNDDLGKLLEGGFDIIRCIRYATQPYDQPNEEAKKLKVWSHRWQPIYEVTNKTAPQLNRMDLEGLVGQYLQLPFRCEHIDRILTDALLALELYQFSDEMINEIVVPELGPPRSPLKQTHPLRGYLKGNFQTAAFLFIVGLGVYGLHRIHLLNDGWEAGGFVVIGLLLIFCVGVSTLALPLAWGQHAKAVRNIRMLMGEMVQTYNELRTDGPVSVRHLLERMKMATEKGVSWPGPLYALLDDVMARTGRV